MGKKHKKILKKINKRIQQPKYGHLHIRKSLFISLLCSCLLLLGSTINFSYANNTSLKLKHHFQKQTTQKTSGEYMVSDILNTIESVHKLEKKYFQILEEKSKDELGNLSKGEIAYKLSIVSEKLKNISYEELINNSEKKEEFAQLLALKNVLSSLYDHNYYAKHVDLDSLLGE